jgi:hypothetical protein
MLKHLVKIVLVVLFVFTSINSYSQYVRYTEDTAKIGFGIGAKAGMIYDYPFFNNRSDISPIGELDFYIVLDKLQINTGLGFFSNNSSWHQAPDQFNPEKNGTTQTGNFYIPLNVDFRLFNIKRNIFSLKFGFNMLFSTTAYITETTINGTINYQFPKTVYGLGTYLGFKYTRHVGDRILIGAELDLNFALLPGPASLLGTNYNSGYSMISRHPNGDFKICFEYIFGKKHLNYLDPSKKKKRKKEGDIIDED